MSRSPLLARAGEFTEMLLTLYHDASLSALTNGRAWYPAARAIIREWAVVYHQPSARIASVIAALSPQLSWERNLIVADDLLAERRPSLRTIQANYRKAQDILRQDDIWSLADVLTGMTKRFPTGSKVQCFAQNLAGDDYVVTVDTHCFQAAFNDPTLRRTFHPPAYRLVASCYQQAADILLVDPATFQAVIWCSWKERYPKTDKRELRRQW